MRSADASRKEVWWLWHKVQHLYAFMSEIPPYFIRVVSDEFSLVLVDYWVGIDIPLSQEEHLQRLVFRE